MKNGETFAEKQPLYNAVKPRADFLIINNVMDRPNETSNPMIVGHFID